MNDDAADPAPPPSHFGELPALVVEDQALVRRWLVQLLRSHVGCTTVHEAARVDEALAAVAALPPLGLALVDLNLPDGSGTDVIAALRQRHPTAVVVVSTVYDDDRHVFPALAAGAHGYLLKEQDPATLGPQLARILDGEPPLSPSVARRLMDYFQRRPVRAAPGPDTVAAALAPPAVVLTSRETEVLSLIGRGLRTGEVARLLGLSEHTVARYVKEIYRKLDISSRAEAALEASRRGLT